MREKISLVVCTLDEEENIGDCIRSSAGLADEVVIVDMHSGDRTREIAAGLGAAVHLVDRKPFVDPTRAYAVSLAAGKWVLMLDADERLTPELSARLSAIAGNDEADVVQVFRETYMFGRRIRYTGWQNEYHYLFFKKGFLSFPATEVHPSRLPSGRVMRVPESEGTVLHYNYRDISHFMAKLNAYTDGEAVKLLRSGGKQTPLRGVYWGIRHFLRRYIVLRGYKDGVYGFVLSVLMGFYWFLAFCKAWEAGRKRSA